MKARVFFLLACMTAWPIRGGDLVSDPFQPAHFTALHIERNERGKSTIILLSGDAVIYKVTDGGKNVETVTVHPAIDDWFMFIQGMNEAKVYKWAPRYSASGEGVTWIVDFTTDTRTFSSSGANEFPKTGAEEQPQGDPSAGPSIPFEQFWQSALALVGKAKPPVMVK
jgi:hypothetical protein